MEGFAIGNRFERRGAESRGALKKPNNTLITEYLTVPNLSPQFERQHYFMGLLNPLIKDCCLRTHTSDFANFAKLTTIMPPNQLAQTLEKFLTQLNRKI